MQKHITFLVALILLNCSNGQTKEAVNGIESQIYGLCKQQSELITNTAKFFPNNTELSIAVIKDKAIYFIGVKRVNDTIRTIDNRQDAFEIGSITKVFTSTLLSDLVQKERLQLQDNIQDYLDFEINTNKKITFQELANHTSGLPRLPSNLNLIVVDKNNPYKTYDAQKLKAYLTSDIDLNKNEPQDYQYSNLGAGLLGYILTNVATSTYENLLQDNIFQKYKMLNSTSKKQNLKTRLVGGLNPDGDTTPNWDFDALAGAGAVFSTTEDLSKFALAQFDKTNKELIRTQQPTFKINKRMRIGLGWHIIKSGNGNELIWHNGGTGGYCSSMALDLEGNSGVIILSNVSAFSKQMKSIDQLCFGLMKTLKEK